MAAVQTTYNEDIPVGYAGMVANGETSNRISRTAEAAIGFGKVAFRGTDDHGCAPTGTQVLGITIAHSGLGLLPGQTADTYPQYENVAIMTQGVIWIVAGEAVTDGAQAYVTSGGAIVDTSTSNTILPGWFFDQTAASGALVRLAKR